MQEAQKKTTTYKQNSTLVELCDNVRGINEYISLFEVMDIKKASQNQEALQAYYNHLGFIKEELEEVSGQLSELLVCEQD